MIFKMARFDWAFKFLFSYNITLHYLSLNDVFWTVDNLVEWRHFEETKQEFGDDLTVYVLNLFPVANTLPSLVATTLVKVEIYFFQTVTWSK